MEEEQINYYSHLSGSLNLVTESAIFDGEPFSPDFYDGKVNEGVGGGLAEGDSSLSPITETPVNGYDQTANFLSPTFLNLETVIGEVQNKLTEFITREDWQKQLAIACRLG